MEMDEMDQFNPNSEGFLIFVCVYGGANCAQTFYRVKVILRKFIFLKFEAQR